MTANPFLVSSLEAAGRRGDPGRVSACAQRRLVAGAGRWPHPRERLSPVRPGVPGLRPTAKTFPRPQSEPGEEVKVGSLTTEEERTTWKCVPPPSSSSPLQSSPPTLEFQLHPESGFLRKGARKGGLVLF